MTQPTIKEKMEGAVEAIAGGVTHFELNVENVKILLKKHLDFKLMTELTIKDIKKAGDELTDLLGELPEMEDARGWMTDFARLICEEMMNTNCSCRNCPETKQKAQEIFKVLE